MIGSHADGLQRGPCDLAIERTKAYFGLGVHLALGKADGVFNLSEAGKFFGRTILASLTERERTGRVLDVGTGSGVLAIIAKTFGCLDVTATDVEEQIISLARQNASLNLGRYLWLADQDPRWRPEITFAVSDLFENRAIFPEGDEGWDLILFNPPGWPTPTGEVLRQRLLERLGSAYYSRFEGDEVILRFLQQAPERLRQGGRILLSLNSMVGVDAIFSRFHEWCRSRGARGLKFRSLAQRDIELNWSEDRWYPHKDLILEQLDHWHEDLRSCFSFENGKLRFTFDIVEAVPSRGGNE